MRSFQTPHYSGVWIPFDGDRMTFRSLVEACLREKLNDSAGTLQVGDDGPRWVSSKKINLSYSHTGTWGLLVFSETHEIGVDIESKDRNFSMSPLKIAERYFEASEVEILKRLSGEILHLEFLKIWVKKEAFAKLTRKGLVKTVHLNLGAQRTVTFATVAVVPVGIMGASAILAQR